MKYGKILSYGVLFSILGLVSENSIWAWEADKLVDLNYFFIPAAELKNEDGKIEMNSAQAMAMVPLSLGEATFLAFGVDYQGLFVGYEDMPESYDFDGQTWRLPKDLHALDLILGLGLDLSEDWFTYFEFRPGIHSDMDDLNQDDIYYQGGIIISYVLSDSFSLSLGGYYADEFGQPELFPLAGVQWEIGDGFILDTLLPDYLVLSCQAAPWLGLGLRGRLKGHQFRLSQDLPWKNTVVDYSQILAGPFIDLIPWEHLVLRLEGGISTAREFKFRDDDSSAKLYDGDIEDGVYASASLALQY